jgi:adenosylmethionine-8-amino-7-oxononanoate aminotransferase
VMTAYKPVKTSTWIMSMHCQTWCVCLKRHGGTIPMAITTFTSIIFWCFYDEDINKVFLVYDTLRQTYGHAAIASLSYQSLEMSPVRVNQNHLVFNLKSINIQK